MSTFNESDHPRAGGGQFTNKEGSQPDISLLPDIQSPDASVLAEMTPQQHRAMARHNFDLNREFAGSHAKAAEFAAAAVPRPGANEGIERLRAYRSYQDEVRNVFGDEIREEHVGSSVSDEEHQRLFAKAWDYGHDSGFYAVEQEYINLITSEDETEGEDV